MSAGFLTPEVAQEYLKWFPKDVPAALRRWVETSIMADSHYMFVRQRNGAAARIGYCTRCQREMVLEGKRGAWTSGRSAKCPVCRGKVTVRHERFSRRDIHYETVVIWYDKSPKDKSALVARAYVVKRDYRKTFRDVETQYDYAGLYLFNPAKDIKSFGEAFYLQAHWYYDRKAPDGWGLSWYRRGSVVRPSIRIGSMMGPVMAIHTNSANMEKAVSGTPFGRVDWHPYKDRGYALEFFSLLARFPAVEYLIKVGLGELIDDKLRGSGGRALNLRAKTPWAVLKVTKAQMKALKPYFRTMDSATLTLIQKGLRDGSNYGVDEATAIVNAFGYGEVLNGGDLTFGGLLTVRKAVKYIQAQAQAPATLSNTRALWRDYIQECRQLDMNLEDERVICPKNLREAHAQTSDLIVSKANADLNQKITAQLQKLRRKYHFQLDGLLIRPAASSNELIREGKELHICVGNMFAGNYSYINQYADGKTVLLLVRYADNPDVPYYCVELSPGGRLIQVRGSHNRPATPEVQAFMDAWMRQISKPKKKRDAQEQCVAVAVAI